MDAAPEVTTLWVVVDSAGRVVQSEWDTGPQPTLVSDAVVQQHFGSALGGRISTVYYAHRRIAGRPLAVTWAVVR